jgi:predicted AlkP superfamily pyrophosphatase or phosphodiesterase
LIEQIHGEARRSAYFYNWEPLRNLNQPETLQFAFYDNSSLDLEHGDAETVSAFSERMPRELYDFAFLYLGTVDTAGHAFGWMSPDYLQQVSRVDGLVGKALGAVPDDCTVLIMSDHGGHDRSHGTEDPQDMTIPWLLRGPGIRQDYEIAADVSLIDTAPTLASVLDVPPHGAWEGRCIEEVFA